MANNENNENKVAIVSNRKDLVLYRKREMTELERIICEEEARKKPETIEFKAENINSDYTA
jgi:hypothetical protein